MTTDDRELGASLRDEELQVLRSIYPDYVVDANLLADSSVVRLEVPIELGTARHVSLEPDEEFAGSSSSALEIELTYLPPILLTVTMPSGYPLHELPLVTSIHATHSWLPQTVRLAQMLQESWTEGEGMLCAWTELIRSGEFLEKLALVDDMGNVRLSCAAPQLLSPALVAYNTAAANMTFAQNSYACSICCASVRGSQCVLLACAHVFCRPCLHDYWSFLIGEGSVERVGCADPACVKQAREATEEEVRRVVGEEEVARWKWLRMKKAVEKDPTIIHCPVPVCQAPVSKPAGDLDQGSGWSRFRSCSACGYNFCSFCKRTWHGPLSECPKSVTLAIVLEYLELPEHSAERLALERKFGKGVVSRLVREYEDEKSTEAWLESSTTSCPSCKVHVEKSMGCNHMTCTKCGQHFCYRCGETLRATDPYEHFSQMGSACFGQLFDYQRDQDQWQHVADFDPMLPH